MTLSLRILVILSLASVTATSAIAQITDSRLPISLDAEFSDYDGKTSMLTFQGLKLTQGLISIEADEGRASKLDFEESIWELSGDVSISINGGQILCDSANLQFVDNQLRTADILGAPATFEIQRQGIEETTYAEAETLRYDLQENAIEFSGNAKIVEGGNQIASSFLVYNIAEQRIQAEGSSEEDGKVKITFTPREQDIDDTPLTDDDDSSGQPDAAAPAEDPSE